MAHGRTSLAAQRNKLAEQRTDLAGERTTRAFTRTRLSPQRTALAKARTALALIRTGLAFLAIGLTLFRIFGITMWSFFDAGLIIFSSLMVYFGTRGYRRSRAMEDRLMEALASDRGTAGLLEADGG